MPSESTPPRGRKKEVQWRCLKCGGANEAEPEDAGLGPWTCAACGEAYPAQPGAADAEGRLVACPVCGCPDLYRQRDFNQSIGVAIIIAGAGLAWFWGLWILVAFALIDLTIYLTIPSCVVCYHCHSIARGYGGIEAIALFDLNTSDKYIQVERERGW